jgi:hypothetical protein
VLLVLEPDVPHVTASGIVAVTFEKSQAYANRIGRVVAAGPGHYQPRVYRDTTRREDDALEFAALIPTTLKPGDRVVVRVDAGDKYTYTKRQDFADMYAARLAEWGIPFDSAEFRMIREIEALAVIEGPSEVREGSVAAE